MAALAITTGLIFSGCANVPAEDESIVSGETIISVSELTKDQRTRIQQEVADAATSYFAKLASPDNALIFDEIQHMASLEGLSDQAVQVLTSMEDFDAFLNLPAEDFQILSEKFQELNPVHDMIWFDNMNDTEITIVSIFNVSMSAQLVSFAEQFGGIPAIEASEVSIINSATAAIADPAMTGTTLTFDKIDGEWLLNGPSLYVNLLTEMLTAANSTV